LLSTVVCVSSVELSRGIAAPAKPPRGGTGFDHAIHVGMFIQVPEPNGPARQAAGDHVASTPGRERCGMIGGVAIIGRHARRRQRAGVDEWTSHGHSQGMRPHRARKPGLGDKKAREARLAAREARRRGEAALRVVSPEGVAGRMGRLGRGCNTTRLAFPWLKPCTRQGSCASGQEVRDA